MYVDLKYVSTIAQKNGSRQDHAVIKLYILGQVEKY